jgi:hypothetical protein
MERKMASIECQLNGQHEQFGLFLFNNAERELSPLPKREDHSNLPPISMKSNSGCPYVMSVFTEYMGV